MNPLHTKSSTAGRRTATAKPVPTDSLRKQWEASQQVKTTPSCEGGSEPSTGSFVTARSFDSFTTATPDMDVEYEPFVWPPREPREAIRDERRRSFDQASELHSTGGSPALKLYPLSEHAPREINQTGGAGGEASSGGAGGAGGEASSGGAGDAGGEASSRVLAAPPAEAMRRTKMPATHAENLRAFADIELFRAKRNLQRSQERQQVLYRYLSAQQALLLMVSIVVNSGGLVSSAFGVHALRHVVLLLFFGAGLCTTQGPLLAPSALAPPGEPFETGARRPMSGPPGLGQPFEPQAYMGKMVSGLALYACGLLVALTSTAMGIFHVATVHAQVQEVCTIERTGSPGTGQVAVKMQRCCGAVGLTRIRLVVTVTAAAMLVVVVLLLIHLLHVKYVQLSCMRLLDRVMGKKGQTGRTPMAAAVAAAVAESCALRGAVALLAVTGPLVQRLDHMWQTVLCTRSEMLAPSSTDHLVKALSDKAAPGSAGVAADPAGESPAAGGPPPAPAPQPRGREEEEGSSSPPAPCPAAPETPSTATHRDPGASVSSFRLSEHTSDDSALNGDELEDDSALDEEGSGEEGDEDTETLRSTVREEAESGLPESASVVSDLSSASTLRSPGPPLPPDYPSRWDLMIRSPSTLNPSFDLPEDDPAHAGPSEDGAASPEDTPWLRQSPAGSPPGGDGYFSPHQDGAGWGGSAEVEPVSEDAGVDGRVRTRLPFPPGGGDGGRERGDSAGSMGADGSPAGGAGPVMESRSGGKRKSLKAVAKAKQRGEREPRWSPRERPPGPGPAAADGPRRGSDETDSRPASPCSPAGSLGSVATPTPYTQRLHSRASRRTDCADSTGDAFDPERGTPGSLLSGASAYPGQEWLGVLNLGKDNDFFFLKLPPQFQASSVNTDDLSVRDLAIDPAGPDRGAGFLRRKYLAFCECWACCCNSCLIFCTGAGTWQAAVTLCWVHCMQLPILMSLWLVGIFAISLVCLTVGSSPACTFVIIMAFSPL